MQKKNNNRKGRLRRFTAGALSLALMLTMIPLTAITALAEPEIIYGDVDGSGKVDETDSSVLKKYLSEYKLKIDEKAADVNVDGKVDLRDLLLIEQFVSGVDIVLGNIVTVTFDARGGKAVASVRLCRNATLGSILDEMPSTEKEGFVFSGWVDENNEPFYAEDAVTDNITIYASFSAAPAAENLSVTSFSLEDQKPDLSCVVTAGDTLTETEVRNAMTLTAVDGSDAVELSVVKGNKGEFTVSAKNGFNEGSSYQLALSDGVNFKGKDTAIRTFNFTIHKDEVENVAYNDDIIYIKDTDDMSYTLKGSDTAVPVLETEMLSNKESDKEVTGSFDYAAGGLAVGNIVCIYEKTNPEQRDYVNNGYDDDAASYIEITAVNGSNVSFKAINESDADKVFFVPDTIPFSVAALPTGATGTVNSADVDTTAWTTMGNSKAPEFDKGDFIVFYNGSFSDINEDSKVYYAEVTAVENDKISYKKTTLEAIKKSQDLFLQNPVSGDTLLENVDTEKVENSVETQAIRSGFADEAAEYLASAAQETDGFKNMKPESFSATTADGKKVSKSQLKAIGGKWSIGDDVSVTATLGKSSKYFTDGLSLKLRIDAEFSVDGGEGGELKIELSATFVEEISVDINVTGNVKIKWYSFIPKINSLTFGASVDLKNYSAISIDVKIYTVQKEDESFFDKLKNISKKYGDLIEKAEMIKEKIDQAKETAEKLKEYKEQLEDVWGSIKEMSDGEVTMESFTDLCKKLGEVNVTSELTAMLNITDEDEMEAGVQNIMERYSKMLETESDWITLVEKPILDRDIIYKFFAIGFEVDFVIKANINIALGANLEYVVGKRYSFWIDIVGKKSGSDTMDLLDERFDFQFYVMGAIGIKMGIKAEIRVGIISTKIGSIGVSAEFGPYIKLWGYFVYEYSKMRPAGTELWNYDEKMLGALYLEFGLYIEVAFEAQVLDGLLSYNPTLVDKEFPLLSAGNRINYYGFGYDIDPDEKVLVEDTDRNSKNGIRMMLPESYRLMNYIDLVEGTLEKETADYSRFAVSLSNRNFHLDTDTGFITVDVPKDVRYMECNLTLTWKLGKLEFSSRDITVTIPLVWTNLSVSEMNQKFTVTVKVGNPEDGYTAVWSDRVRKSTEYNLPTKEEILDIIGYDKYESDNGNLKYSSVTGYGLGETTNLTTYTDKVYYFDVTPRKYTMNINDVQNADGSTAVKSFTAGYGESFDLSELYSSGTENDDTREYTSYLRTDAVKNGAPASDNFDINSEIDNTFAKMLLDGTTFNAKYTGNSAEVTYNFNRNVVNIADKTVNVKKGSIAPDVFSEEATSKGVKVIDVTPSFGTVRTDTAYDIQCQKSDAPSHTLTYHTSTDTTVKSMQIKEDSLILRYTPPALNGYRFVAWFSDPQLKKVFNTSSAVMPKADLDLYAKWAPNTYEVTFDANEGSLPSSSAEPMKVTFEAAYGTLPVPYRAGYKFLGWFTSRTGESQIDKYSTCTTAANTTLYAQWEEKKTVNGDAISYEDGQSVIYDGKDHYFEFVSSEIPTETFDVYYKREGLDDEFTETAVNAGVYDVKLVHNEDENYGYYEKVLTSVYTIEKADSSIFAAPNGTAFYGNIVADKMIKGVDYVGDGQLEFAASKYNYETRVEKYYALEGFKLVKKERVIKNEFKWNNAYCARNAYDESDQGNQLYLWVRLAEGENYKASETKVSVAPITITDTPDSAYNDEQIVGKFHVKTSDIKNAGTNSKIYLSLDGGEYVHLNNSGNDLEKGDEDVYTVYFDKNYLHNSSYGTIKADFKFEPKGTAPGWHCEWVRLDLYKDNALIVLGNQYDVNHWFEDNIIYETFSLTGYEKDVTGFGDFNNGETEINLTDADKDDYNWQWNGNVDTQYGSYNAFTKLNAPELSAVFDNDDFNSFIYCKADGYSVDRAGLYKAMADSGVAELTLNVALNYAPVKGNVTATAGSTISKSVTFRCADAGKQKAESVASHVIRRNTAKALPFAVSAEPAKITETVQKKTADTFDVTYNLTGSSGVWATKLAVNYDKSKVELEKITAGDLFAADEITAPETTADGRYVFLASRNDFLNAYTGTRLVTLSFKAKSGVSIADKTYVDIDNAATMAINTKSRDITAKTSSAFDDGDVDRDGNITAADALTALQGSVNKVQLDAEQFILADVDRDGNITAVDALLILQKSVGKIKEF